MDEPKKSRRGGARPNAGRKGKGHKSASGLSEIDIKAALAAGAPEEIEAVAQRHVRPVLDALVKVMLVGASEAARVNAANAILDRGYGKPTVESGGDAMLPFFGAAPSKQLATEVRSDARKFAPLAIEVLARIAEHGESEAARVQACKALWDRGLGAVAPAKVPDEALRRPTGKKEEQAQAALSAGTGRYATPPAPNVAPKTLQ